MSADTADTTPTPTPISREATQIREDHPQLVDAILEHTDHRRWDAIEMLSVYGFSNIEISEACDFHSNYISKYRSRNRDKYADRKPGRQTQPVLQSQPQADGNEPTGYISNLDHYSWGRKYAPHMSEWDRLDYLEDLQEQVWNMFKLLVETARDHGKTWTMIKLFARWTLEKHTRVICIATQAKKDEIYQGVLEILTSDEVRADYGDIVARNKSGEIWFVEPYNMPIGANFVVKGAESFITGLHADDGWIHLEDIVQEMKVAEAAEKRVRQWFKRTVRYMAGLNTKLTGTGTRKDLQDFYGWLVDEFHFPLYLQEGLTVESGRMPTIDEIVVDHEREVVVDYPAVGVYRTLGCPNFPLERLLYEFIYHTEDAEAELNNNPLPSKGAYFDGANWIESELPQEYFNTYIVCDPAFGGTSTSSKTAILVLGIYKGKLWIVDAFIGRADFDEKEEIIIQFWTTYSPLQTWIEDNFNQMSRSFSKNSRLTNLQGLHLIQSTNDKKERIGAMNFPYKTNDIVIATSCPFKMDLKAEYLTFSLDDTPSVIRSRYNGLDALSIAYLKLRSHLKTRASQLTTPKVRTASSSTRRVFG